MRKIAAAGVFTLGIGLGCAGANAAIVVGPGFGTPCAQGGCPVLGSSVNAIGAHSLDLYQSTTFPGVAINSLLLIFAVPNNPENALTSNPVTSAQLHTPSTNASSTPVSVGSLSSETEMTHGDVAGALGLLEGNSVGFRQLQSADYALFPTSYDAATNPIVNFSLYTINLATGEASFGPNDLINVNFTSLPVGTFVLGYGTPSLSVTDTPFEEAGVSGLASTVPEPTSLMLLATALAAFGLGGAVRQNC